MLDRPMPVGALLRTWRQRRRLSQLQLACDAEISTRHLSFIETGRAQPSRDMLLRLCEQLDVPMRERNVVLVAAGYAPMFPDRPLEHQALAAARAAIELVLHRQKPYPAFALDKRWSIVASNAALPELYDEVAPELMRPPVNAMRLSLHPHGLAPRIINLAEWRAHLLLRLRRQIEITADPVAADLLREVSDYPVPSGKPATVSELGHEIAVPFQVSTGAGVLSFFSMTTVFGTPVDVTLCELALELFFPADDATAILVQRMAAAAATAT
jgi:transcriptional regulator with XRE-family HTH domain